MHMHDAFGCNARGTRSHSRDTCVVAVFRRGVVIAKVRLENWPETMDRGELYKGRSRAHGMETESWMCAFRRRGH